MSAPALPPAGATSLPSDDALRELAGEILARPEYARFQPVDLERLEGLLGRIEAFLDRLAGLADTSPWLYALVVGGLLLLAAGLLLHVVVSLRAALGQEAPPRPARPGGPEPPRFAEEAARLAGERRFLEAAHQLQLGCIDVCLRRGVLELRRHEPNRTLRHRLRDSALPEAERREFEQLVGTLERQWFRDRRDERSLYEAWRGLHARLAGARAA